MGPLRAATIYPTWDALIGALEEGAAAPKLVVRWWAPPLHGDLAAIHAYGEAGLLELQRWLTHPALADAALVWVTVRGVGAHARELVEPTLAPLWGLARTVHHEAPDRSLQLLDVDEKYA